MPERKVLLTLTTKFFESNLQHATHSLEALDPPQATQILKTLSHPMCVRALGVMEPRYAARVILELPEELIREIVQGLSITSLSEIFLSLSAEKKQALLNLLSSSTQRHLLDIITYPENSAGRILNLDILAFHADMKVKEAIQKIRTFHKKTPMNYVYVVDESNCLAGVLNMRDLLLASQDATLDTVMVKDVFAVNAAMDREEVALLVSQKRYLAVPVIDHENHLLGAIKTEELLQLSQEEATEDIQKMFGAGGDEKALSSIGFAIRKRLPWLYINLATAFLAAFVVGLFENIIAKITALAVLMPIVAGQGGNAGAQALAVVIRGLALKEISPTTARQVIVKEGIVGLANGIAIGLVTSVAAWYWNENPLLGLIIGMSMVVNLVAAGISGALIPIAMKSLGWDPAQSSSIILTTVTDVIGFASFLGFATLFQYYLL